MTLAEVICAQNYTFTDPKSCGRCPIVAACHQPVAPLNRVTLDAHLLRLHDAALSVTQGQLAR